MNCKICKLPLTTKYIKAYQEESGIKEVPICCEDCAKILGEVASVDFILGQWRKL